MYILVIFYLVLFFFFLALRHPDGKIIENNEKNSQKIDAKSPASIMKKNKVKSKKELPDSVIHNIPLKPPNKQPSKVLIQVDRRRVNCTTGRDTLYISRNPDIQDIKSTIDNCKNEKEIIQKVDAARVKKTKDDRNFPTFKQNSPKLLLNGSIDHNESNLFSKSRDKIESKKLKNMSHEIPEKFENEKFKVVVFYFTFTFFKIYLLFLGIKLLTNIYLGKHFFL